MKHPPDNAPTPQSASMDETLHLITHLPVPEGLEQRVHTAVFRPVPRPGRILSWPVSADPLVFGAGSNWARAAAAAAIVLAVTGGGWGVYRRVEHPAAARVIAIPVAQPAASRGFSSAGAIRTPQTVKGPTVQPAGTVPKHARRKSSARHGTSARPVAGRPVPASGNSK